MHVEYRKVSIAILLWYLKNLHSLIFCFRKSENKEITDEEDLAAVIYNNIFNLIFVVKSLGTLRIYNAEVSTPYYIY